MKPLVRPAAADDEPALAAIDRATWSQATTPAPRPRDDAPFFEDGRVVEDVLVALVDDEVVGYVLVGIGYPMPAHAHVWFLRGLAVSPTSQGSGVATVLVRAAIAECMRRGARKVRSNVLATNPASLAVHRRCGFVVEGTLVAEFIVDGQPVDDVLLAFRVDDPTPPATSPEP